MRFKFKWMVAIGLVLGVASIWWELSSSRKNSWGDDLLPETDPKQVHAREATPAVGVGANNTIAPGPTWQNGVSQVFNSRATTADQAKRLLVEFPNLPPAGQFEAAHHISNLLPDDAYGDWAGYLTNVAVSSEARNVIYADLMLRPNSVKLPLLLQLAQSPASPKSAEAAQALRSILREDFGADWPAWSQRIEAWLKANPDPTRPGISGMTVGN